MNVELYIDFINSILADNQALCEYRNGDITINHSSNLYITTIKINKVKRTVTMLDLDVIKYDGSPDLLPKILEASKTTEEVRKEFYIPYSEEDAFQKSTDIHTHILPFELVSHFDKLIETMSYNIRLFKLEPLITNKY